MKDFCNAGPPDKENEAETKAFNSMCDRCVFNQGSKKKGGLCRKKWDKFMNGKFDKEGGNRDDSSEESSDNFSGDSEKSDDNKGDDSTKPGEFSDDGSEKPSDNFG